VKPSEEIPAASPKIIEKSSIIIYNENSRGEIK